MTCKHGLRIPDRYLLWGNDKIEKNSYLTRSGLPPIPGQSFKSAGV